MQVNSNNVRPPNLNAHNNQQSSFPRNETNYSNKNLSQSGNLNFVCPTPNTSVVDN